MDNVEKIVIGGQEFVVSVLDPQVQAFINFFKMWTAEENILNEEIYKKQIELAKLEAAKLHIISEIEKAVLPQN